MSEGDFLYFIVDPKNGNHICDSTELDVTIQQGSTTWNLASEFRVSPGQANPSPDGYGNPEVWHFMESATLQRDPATYTLLPDFITDAFLIEGLQQWHGTEVSGPNNDNLPAVGINSTGSVIHFSDDFSWEAGVIRVHPTASKLAVVGWRSPMEGELSIYGSFTQMVNTCGNGFNWFIDNDVGTLAQGGLP